MNNSFQRILIMVREQKYVEASEAYADILKSIIEEEKELPPNNISTSAYAISEARRTINHLRLAFEKQGERDPKKPRSKKKSKEDVLIMTSVRVCPKDGFDMDLYRKADGSVLYTLCCVCEHKVKVEE